jgi:hypothetical protein
MYDGGKIITGLVIFIGLVTLPLWFNQARGEAIGKPQPKIVTETEYCVAPVDYMRTTHPQLLNEWRDLSVREGKKLYIAYNGVSHQMSLSKTCLECHPNKVEFCDQCHNYVGVTPYCWDCHIEPKEND